MPIYRFHLDSTLAPDAVQERLSSNVRPSISIGELVQRVLDDDLVVEPSLQETLSGLPAEPLPFIGTISDRSFEIVRQSVSTKRNAFAPRIKGKIDAAPAGSRVHVVMSAHPFAVVFMLAWLAAVIFLSNTSAGGWNLVTTGMLLMGIVFPPIGFFPQAIKAKRQLVQALAGERP